MRLHRKSDADLLAMVMEERDLLAKQHEFAALKLAQAEFAAEEWRKMLAAANERIGVLEETQKQFYQQQNDTVKTLLAGTVESNAPVVWPEREQVKMNAAPPRSVMATMKDRAIKGALKAQKKPEVVQ